jgi:hypothetical protein
MPDVEYDPVTLTLIIIYNSIIIGMAIKWLIPEVRKLIGKEVV